MLRLLRILKLLRIQKLKSKWHELTKTKSDTTMWKLLAAVVTILFCCHLFACLWFWIGTAGQDGAMVNPKGWVAKVAENTGDDALVSCNNPGRPLQI